MEREVHGEPPSCETSVSKPCSWHARYAHVAALPQSFQL